MCIKFKTTFTKYVSGTLRNKHYRQKPVFKTFDKYVVKNVNLKLP